MVNFSWPSAQSQTWAPGSSTCIISGSQSTDGPGTQTSRELEVLGEYQSHNLRRHGARKRARLLLRYTSPLSRQRAKRGSNENGRAESQLFEVPCMPPTVPTSSTVCTYPAPGTRIYCCRRCSGHCIAISRLLHANCNAEMGYYL